MGFLFGSPNLDKVKRMDKQLEEEGIQKARAQGGCCRNCRYYDSFREVCTGGVTWNGMRDEAHVTTPNSICRRWKA